MNSADSDRNIAWEQRIFDIEKRLAEQDDNWADAEEILGRVERKLHELEVRLDRIQPSAPVCQKCGRQILTKGGKCEFCNL